MNISKRTERRLTKANWIMTGFIIASLMIGIARGQVMTEPDSKTGTTHGTTWDETCLKGTCTRTLYSGIRNVNENGWIRIEDSKGELTEYFDVIYMENDMKNDIRVVNITYKCITVEPIIKDMTETNKDIPLKVDGTTIGTVRFASIFQKSPTIKMCIEEDNALSINDGTATIYDTREWKETPLGMNYTFGEHSTTIQLQDADSENLDDGSAHEDYSTDEFGARKLVYWCDFDGHQIHSLMKFNITSINDDVEDAVFCVYVEGDYASGGEWITVTNHDATGFVWTEGTGGYIGDSCEGSEYCWNNPPPSYLDAEDEVTFNDGFTGWLCWNSTNMVSNRYDDGNSSVSIYTINSGGNTNGQYDTWRATSKEGDTISQRPYLNITYSAGEPPEEGTCYTITEGRIEVGTGCGYDIIKGEGESR